MTYAFQHTNRSAVSDGRKRVQVNDEKPGWTFLTNHAHVLACIAEEPDVRGRDIAQRVGITERAAQASVSDLVAVGYVTRTRVGRRNHYEIDAGAPLRHPLDRGISIGDLLVSLGKLQKPATRPRRRAKA